MSQSFQKLYYPSIFFKCSITFYQAYCKKGKLNATQPYKCWRNGRGKQQKSTIVLHQMKSKEALSKLRCVSGYTAPNTCREEGDHAT